MYGSLLQKFVSIQVVGGRTKEEDRMRDEEGEKRWSTCLRSAFPLWSGARSLSPDLRAALLQEAK